MGGMIFDVARCSLHDGPGIRTTLFLKGCPLRCAWCHNPESQRFEAELALFEQQCNGCGACVAACPSGAHAIDPSGGHALDRSRCAGDGCGACVRACPSGALRWYGQRADASELIDLAAKDRAYYDASGGGLTISGGEPLAQPAFLMELLALAKRAGLHTCVETSGFAAWGVIERALPLVDVWLYDIKAPPGAAHEALVGAPSQPILDNLARLLARGARVTARCPVVPGLTDTDEHFAHLASLARRHPELSGIEILPYHDLGRSKAAAIGSRYALSTPSADDQTKADWKRRLRQAGVPESALSTF